MLSHSTLFAPVRYQVRLDDLARNETSYCTIARGKRSRILKGKKSGNDLTNTEADGGHQNYVGDIPNFRMQIAGQISTAP
jgi:hypothetical protein